MKSNCAIPQFSKKITRKEAVKRLIHQFETHPIRVAFKAEVRQNYAYNPFSEESQDMIQSVGNVEYCEMCEISKNSMSSLFDILDDKYLVLHLRNLLASYRQNAHIGQGSLRCIIDSTLRDKEKSISRPTSWKCWEAKNLSRSSHCGSKSKEKGMWLHSGTIFKIVQLTESHRSRLGGTKKSAHATAPQCSLGLFLFKTQNRPWGESCVSLEVTRLFPEVGCVRDTLQSHTVRRNLKLCPLMQVYAWMEFPLLIPGIWWVKCCILLPKNLRNPKKNAGKPAAWHTTKKTHQQPSWDSNSPQWSWIMLCRLCFLKREVFSLLFDALHFWR